MVDKPPSYHLISHSFCSTVLNRYSHTLDFRKQFAKIVK